MKASKEIFAFHDSATGSYFLFLNAINGLVLPRVTYIYEDNPGSIVNTTSNNIALTVKSRIIICNAILKNQPSFFVPEYYMYVFFILTRAIDLFERNSDLHVCGDPVSRYGMHSSYRNVKSG